jgi:flagellar L-ring protein FlgH
VTRTKTAALLLALCLLCLPARAGSLWSEESSSPYSNSKAFKIGDIVNLLVVENTSAKSNAGSDTNVKDDFSAKLTHTIQRLTPVIGANNSATGGLANQYTGSGTTSRGNNVTARLSCVVTAVLPNGNLAIRGTHKVEVNNELQQITFSGVIRAQDVSAANTVYSYQVANADMSISGSGTLADAESPGWFTRILNWLF